MIRLIAILGFCASLFIGFGLSFSAPTPPPAAANDQAYGLLEEAYRARDSGNEALAQEKLSAAMALFRETAWKSKPELITSSSDLAVEEGPKEVRLVENRSLFKIEIKPAGALTEKLLEQQEEMFKQQQIMMQQLSLLAKENAEFKALLAAANKNLKELPSVAADVSDIKDQTSRAADSDVESRLDDIENNTNDLNGSMRGIENNTDNLNDVASDISQIRSTIDTLQDILNIVEDIKNDTDKINDLQNEIQDVKSAVERSQ
jgi:DNA repair exonuclease SbcCD ATPase subunit